MSKMSLIVLLWIASISAGYAQTWTPLHNQPPFEAINPLLLTDGSVLVQRAESPDWWRLKPDEDGSYVNGTWSQVASMPNGYAPLYYASAVLPDGRVIVEGGEYLCNGNCTGVWSNLGAIYDPVTNEWTAVEPPDGWTGIGDAQSVVLSDGTFMLANCCSDQAALLDAKKLTWTPTGKNKADSNNEEGWTLLPNGLVLTIDVNDPNQPTSFELYGPRQGRWFSAGSTVIQLDTGNEIGPAILRPDGTVFATGATGHTSVYHTRTGRWTPGPDFPNVPGVGQLAIADGPAALLPNGNVLMGASPGSPSTYFFEFDGANLNPVLGTPHSPNDPSYVINMLVLPTGEILTTDLSDDIEIYTAASAHHHKHTDRYREEWKPKIDLAPKAVKSGGSYVIAGYRFNGMSQGAAYGDDQQSATNYPLVRIRNRSTGHIAYCRTHDHSSMAVASDAHVWTHFDVPDDIESGESELEVVANGIPSNPVTIHIH